MKIELKPFQRKYLQGLAHDLNPVVMIGNNGLTEAVIREIAINLDAHELIKVRVQGDDREARVAMFEQICEDLGAAPVQHIGKLLVLWRPSDKQRIILPKNKQALKG
ncbi:MULTISPECIES: ribosome assembly RNA-binding protein YhbY [Chromobacterium]|uniref:RNA-binding protein n=2 Tax=Chromobacterium TaxID=535 RepID=A0A1W0CXN3_9NEIS|nr:MULTISPECIES: ribosome assembly RNA-binding protein YhbY [Chromobacterium]AXT48105.1 ribosome assembly RNA-binding protein YhbY [Chromobacterium rhizoryzae]MDH0343915.1 ribosome assembly RNA-binding protein YhbY [Chromobacterium haemolyticum]OQS39521.1 RNA-binding protein [Chromobacterium haemolyticum]OQS39896.1 RNA-binding protein [Chromobacterium haemolyticum]PTU71717.1 ribosome assembly RNA-binding protein YhbY [Chromobacterium haemolyticum]